MPDLHRFYFDDGKSRKRWHVQTKGKSQIVGYGRLGGSLRESKKSFKSPKEAAEQTEKLIAKKVREGYVTINPSRLEITRFKGKRKATQQQIVTLENQIGCSLPDEYRDFLTTLNGGTPNPDCVPVPGVAGIDNVGVGTFFYIQPSKPAVNELSYEMNRSVDLLPDGHLPIAGSSDLFTLSLKQKSFGAVYWWFHETEELDDDGNFLESAGYLLAGSFDEFLTRIALLFGDDELAVEPTPKSSGAIKKPTATIKGLLRLVNHDLTPAKVKEIEQVVKVLGDLTGIQDGKWPFTNISNPRIVRCLLKAGLNPEMTDTERYSLLWQCAGNEECVDLLLEHGVNVDRRSGGEHETALMRAIYLENIPAVTRLLKAGANPTVRLSWPISSKLKGNAKLRKMIEKARARWQKDKGQKKKPSRPAKKPAPSKLTAKKSAPQTSNASTTAKEPRKPKPTIHRLLRLMKHDHLTDEDDEIAEIEELVAELGDLSEIQDGQWPKIHKFESPRLLKCLLEAGLNPEIADKGGNSLLSQCVMHPESIDLLVGRGVDVDRRSGRGNSTALMRATYMGDQECVQRLLKAGANPTLEFSGFAKVMLDMDEEMTEFIEVARAAWNRKSRRKKTAKSSAAKKRKK